MTATAKVVVTVVLLVLWSGEAAGECDAAAGTKCLTSELTACKNANKTNACACADAALLCVGAADCAAAPTLLATAQLGFSGSGCEVPPAAAVPSVAGACSITGRSRCFANLNWCAIATRGSNPFPQPGVCTLCNANFFACIIEYACQTTPDTRTAFAQAQAVYKCAGADADFDARLQAASGGTTSAANALSTTGRATAVATASTTSGAATGSMASMRATGVTTTGAEPISADQTTSSGVAALTLSLLALVAATTNF